jgi:diketogulonate reductase-like aldo/keto reductase
MWSVEGNSKLSVIDERQRIGFMCPTPLGGHEPTLVTMLSSALCGSASTGGGVRMLMLENGSEFSVKKAIDEAAKQEEADEANFKASAFGALAEGYAKTEAESLNPKVPMPKRLFYALRLTDDVHRFKESAAEQVMKVLETLELDHLDLVTVPWPADESETLTRKVRNKQVKIMVDTLNGPLVALRNDGFVKAIGGDELQPWHIERVVDDTHENPAFNMLAVSPRHARHNEIRFCQARGIECIAMLGTTVTEEEAERSLHDDPHEHALTDLANALGRTEHQIECTWALQRGLVVLPKTTFPSAHSRTAAAYGEWLDGMKTRLAETYALVHPFARRPLFCSKTHVHRLLLTPADMKAIEKMDVDLAAAAAEVEARLAETKSFEQTAHARTHTPGGTKRTESPGGTSLVGRGASQGYSKGASRGGNGKAADKGGAVNWFEPAAPDPLEAEGVGLGEGGVLLDPNDETAFMRFAEDENVEPEEKLKSMLGLFFSAEASAASIRAEVGALGQGITQFSDAACGGQ